MAPPGNHPYPSKFMGREGGWDEVMREAGTEGREKEAAEERVWESGGGRPSARPPERGVRGAAAPRQKEKDCIYIAIYIAKYIYIYTF